MICWHERFIGYILWFAAGTLTTIKRLRRIGFIDQLLVRDVYIVPPKLITQVQRYSAIVFGCEVE
jgi:hypothetical protein